MTTSQNLTIDSLLNLQKFDNEYKLVVKKMIDVLFAEEYQKCLYHIDSIVKIWRKDTEEFFKDVPEDLIIWADTIKLEFFYTVLHNITYVGPTTDTKNFIYRIKLDKQFPVMPGFSTMSNGTHREMFLNERDFLTKNKEIFQHFNGLAEIVYFKPIIKNYLLDDCTDSRHIFIYNCNYSTSKKCFTFDTPFTCTAEQAREIQDYVNYICQKRIDKVNEIFNQDYSSVFPDEDLLSEDDRENKVVEQIKETITEEISCEKEKSCDEPVVTETPSETNEKKNREKSNDKVSNDDIQLFFDFDMQEAV